ncbi:TIGR04219 family outer membrane beta-barrel protein, partial [Vibrio diabolicus]
MVYFLSRLQREHQLSRSTHYMTNKATIALTALSLAVSFPVFAEYSVSP